MTPPNASPSFSKRRRAVIIGASIAGMCAAAAIAPSFESVTVLEQDYLCDSESRRRGVPQAPFVHGLLEQGRRDIETLFPGFTARLIRSGAPVLDFGADVAALRASGWISPAPIDLLTLWPTRNLLERTIRDLLRTQYDNVLIVEGTKCEGLILGHDRSRVAGIRLIENGKQTVSTDAEFVIDASGAGSKLPAWLQEHDLGPVPEWRVDAKGGYSSRMYRPPTDAPAEWWWKGIVIECAPPDSLTGGVVFPVEQGLWLATIMGFGGEYPPATPKDFDNFLWRLRSPLLANALRKSVPVSEISSSRSFANRFRRYVELPQFPAGLIAMGDAVCCFNPIYSQGMTAAAHGAVMVRNLMATLDPLDKAFGTRFLQRLSTFLAFPWRIATSADSNFPNTDGMEFIRRGPRERYIELLLQAAWHNTSLHSRVARVLHMVEPEERWYTPSTFLRVASSLTSRHLDRRQSRVDLKNPPPNRWAERSIDRATQLLEMLNDLDRKAS